MSNYLGYSFQIEKVLEIVTRLLRYMTQGNAIELTVNSATQDQIVERVKQYLGCYFCYVSKRKGVEGRVLGHPFNSLLS